MIEFERNTFRQTICPLGVLFGCIFPLISVAWNGAWFKVHKHQFSPRFDFGTAAFSFKCYWFCLIALPIPCAEAASLRCFLTDWLGYLPSPRLWNILAKLGCTATWNLHNISKMPATVTSQGVLFVGKSTQLEGTRVDFFLFCWTWGAVLYEFVSLWYSTHCLLCFCVTQRRDL